MGIVLIIDPIGIADVDAAGHQFAKLIRQKYLYFKLTTKDLSHLLLKCSQKPIRTVDILDVIICINFSIRFQCLSAVCQYSCDMWN